MWRAAESSWRGARSVRVKSSLQNIYIIASAPAHRAHQEYIELFENRYTQCVCSAVEAFSLLECVCVCTTGFPRVRACTQVVVVVHTQVNRP